MSTSPHNVPLSSSDQSRKEVKADIPKNIGFRGRHNHGKSVNDPVYPSKKIIPQLRPKSLIDWRTGGRALLVAALAVIERRAKLRRRTDILTFQSRGFCGPSCGFSCAKEKRRLFCAWKVPGTQFEHVNRISDTLVGFKGLNKNFQKKPFFTVPRAVAERSAAPARFCSVDPEGNIKASHFIKSPRIHLPDASVASTVLHEHEASEEAEFLLKGSFHL